ncbi:efflux RND transporter periplasmic adaptor subunit [Tahibacter aquaticus]|uniref:efflux RND transporter periplasmic adaptor subunit n=1 Tax=Tahibacter aquaticus TaxID=520092 RepID=UPI0014150383|nr:efflux RND transporter periplasmic adaptor subunit [Tahibacter aquaticus]
MAASGCSPSNPNPAAPAPATDKSLAAAAKSADPHAHGDGHGGAKDEHGHGETAAADEHGHGAEAKDDHGDGHGDAHSHGEDEHGHGEGEGGHVEDEHGHGEGGHGEGEADVIHLTDAQIEAAGIETAVVRSGAAAATTVPAVIAADSEKSTVVVAAVGGRVVSLTRNLGEAVKAGDALAVIESREAAELQADVEAQRQRSALAEATLKREEQLFAQKVSPEQDVLQARAAAAEARIRLRLAQQRLGTTGGAGGSFNRIVVRSPQAGHIVARSVGLGQAVQADAELFRVADLSVVAVELALPPQTASLVAVGGSVSVSVGDREASGRLAFVSPVIDPETRQVRAIALLRNDEGRWRVGETVQASVATGSDAYTLSIPKNAVQTVEDKPSVFVRTNDGFAVKHLELGPGSGAFVVVRSGLNGGERIAVKNSYVLKAEAGKGEGGGHHDH